MPQLSGHTLLGDMTMPIKSHRADDVPRIRSQTRTCGTGRLKSSLVSRWDFVQSIAMQTKRDILGRCEMPQAAWVRPGFRQSVTESYLQIPSLRGSAAQRVFSRHDVGKSGHRSKEPCRRDSHHSISAKRRVDSMGIPSKKGPPIGSYRDDSRRAGAPRALPRSSFRFVRVTNHGHPGAGWSSRLGISRCSSS